MTNIMVQKYRFLSFNIAPAFPGVIFDILTQKIRSKFIVKSVDQGLQYFAFECMHYLSEFAAHIKHFFA